MGRKSESHDSNNVAGDIIRPLGHLENFQSALYLLGLYRGTIVTCRYNIPDEFVDESAQEQLMNKLELAIAAAVLQHPFLRVGIINDDSKCPYWVQLSNIDLAHHIQWQQLVEGSVEEYQTLYNSSLREQLDTEFSNLRTRPGWRIVVLRSKGKPSQLDLIFVWNHSIVDGMSGKIFQETVLRHLNHPVAVAERPELQNHVLRLTAAERLPPPMNKMAKFPVTLAFAAATTWQELKPSFLVGENSMNATWAPIRRKPYETTQRIISLDSGTLQNILSACRRNKTTLTGLLHAAVLATQLTEKEAPAFASISALNMRRYMPSKSVDDLESEIDQTMANFVSRHIHKFDKALVKKIRDLAAVSREPATPSERNCQPSLQIIAGTDALMDILWTVAARVRGELQRRLDLGLKNDIVVLMGLVGDWRSQMKEELKKPRTVAWNVTNLGVMDGKLEATEIAQAQDTNNDNKPDGVPDSKG
ncbi:alcohol acetyltransferase domain-containing protein [Trichoderma austrokoningii]